MTAELERNLWLEINPTRLILMAGVLAAIFAVAGLSDNRAEALRTTAEGGFFAIVGVWGAFKAARAITDEIRDRTWDFQRMSGVAPMAMAFGKLFGATAYVWFGGLICVAVAVFAAHLEGKSAADLAAMAVRMVFTGVLAHAAALAASIAGARRQRGNGRFDGALFVLAGLGAYWFVGAMFEAARPTEWSDSGEAIKTVASLDWWGRNVSAPDFWLASVTLFAMLAIATCWRLMRAELQAAPEPLWYAVGATVAAVWMGGLGDQPVEQAWLAFVAFAAATYVTLWSEPKDVVGWRALSRALGTPQADAGAVWPASLTGFALCAAAAIGVAIVWIIAPPADAKDSSALWPFAALLFIARDIAIFAFFHLGERQKRGDFAAVLTIALLYGLGPAFLGVLGFESGLALFFPVPDGDLASHIVSVASGLVQVCIVGLAVKARFEARSAGLSSMPAPTVSPAS